MPDEMRPVNGFPDAEFITTGSLKLDWALGGGLPRGKPVMIYGPEYSGKTTIGLIAAQATVRNGGSVAYIDAENGLSPAFATAFGLYPSTQENPTRFGLFQAGNAEKTLNLIGYLMRLRTKDSPNKSPVDLIVLDSVPALVPQAILEGEVGDLTVAAQARAIAAFFQVYKDDIANSGCAFLIINQVRDDIGGRVFNGIKPVRIPGGRALKFYSWIIGEVKYPTPMKSGKQIIAKEFRVVTRKNKLAMAPLEAKFVVYLDGNNQPDSWRELASVGKELAVFTKEDGIEPADRGYWYFEGEKLGNGEKQTTEILIQNPELAHRVQAAIRVALRESSRTLKPVEADVLDDDEDEEDPDNDDDDRAGHDSYSERF